MPSACEQINNDVFIQLQGVLIQQIEDETAGAEPLDITRMLATKLAFIQRAIAKVLADAKAT